MVASFTFVLDSLLFVLVGRFMDSTQFDDPVSGIVLVILGIMAKKVMEATGCRWYNQLWL